VQQLQTVARADGAGVHDVFSKGGQNGAALFKKRSITANQ
jgi:hypothetical protein